LDAMITRVRCIKQIVRPDPQGTDAAELPGLCSLTAPGAEEVSLRVELGDAPVFAELRNVPVAACILNHIADVAELPRTGSGLAAERRAQLNTFVAVQAEAVVVRITHDEVVIAVDTQAAGPAVAVVGRGPRVAKVVAVAIVDLDAGGVIDNIQA